MELFVSQDVADWIFLSFIFVSALKCFNLWITCYGSTQMKHIICLVPGLNVFVLLLHPVFYKAKYCVSILCHAESCFFYFFYFRGDR